MKLVTYILEFVNYQRKHISYTLINIIKLVRLVTIQYDIKIKKNCCQKYIANVDLSIRKY
jgi:hypothetical protein